MKDPNRITRKQFMKQFVEGRDQAYRAAVAAGTMLSSEAAMGMMYAKKDAAKIWRQLLKQQKEKS